MENLVGKTIDRYHILNKFPEGGMGVVYGAVDTRLERSVAIKFIRTDKIAPSDLDHLLRRFEREARVLARFDHPNIVTIYDYGEYQNQPYLVMQYLSGGSLKDFTGQKMSWHEALQFASQIAAGLAYAHQAGVLHRDIKPGNILLTQEGKVKIADFGIARMLETGDGTQLTATGIGIGTPDYMSPEQCLGMEANRQSDVYALGVVLYELITGNKPFTADTPMAVMIKQVHDPLPDPRTYVPDLSEVLHKLLLKALEKDPALRFVDMHSFELAIRELLTLDLPPFISNIKEKDDKPAVVIDEQESTLTNSENQNDASSPLAGVDLETSVDLEPLDVDQQTEILPAADLKPVAATERKNRKKPILFILVVVGLILIAVILYMTGVISPYNRTAQARTRINPVDGMVQVYVAGGKFQMGNQSGAADEQPLHELILGSYWIDQYEVSNQQYAACVEAGICVEPAETGSMTRSAYYGSLNFQNYPVIYITWQAALNYCNWAGGRLPTEAEWEKAARGSLDLRLYPWGDQPPDCEMANSNNCVGDTSAIGSYTQNISPFGVYDMTGNVSEWVSDWYQADAYSGKETINPTGPTDGYKKVIRGGDWYADNTGIKLTYRDRNYPDFRGPLVGFRCAASVD